MLIEQLILDDAPIRTIAGDLLGRGTFVESLASAMLLPPKGPCRVVALEGSWGEGKTSAIEMALDVVGRRDADLRPFVVRINPWLLGTKDALVRALLLEISKTVRSEGRRQKASSFINLADELFRYSSALSLLKVEPQGLILAGVARVSLWLAQRISRKESDLQSFKGRIGAAIERLDRPIIVVIDDLDRLLPEEVLEVIRFIRAVGDFERTTYILAFDYPRIIESLSKAGVPSAPRFMEKIVQLRLHLPPIDARSIRNILYSKLEESHVYNARRVFSESDSRRVELYSFYISPLLLDVRTLFRVLARLEMTPVAVVREVEYWDVFALNVVSVVAPDVFDFIRSNASAFTKVGSDLPKIGGGDKSPVDELKIHLDEILGGMAHRTSRYVKGLVYSLFPLLNERMSKSSMWMDRNGRVGVERPLVTYLISGVLEGGLPLDTVRALITENKFREERIAAISQQEDQFIALTVALRDELIVSELEVEGPAELIILLVEKSNDLPVAQRNFNLTMADRSTTLVPLLVDLLNRTDGPDKPLREVMSLDVEGTVSAALLEGLVSPDSEDMQRLRSCVPEYLIGMLMKDFSEKVHTIASRYSRSDETRMGPLLFALRRIDGSMYHEVIKRLLPSQKNSRVLIRSLTNSIYSSAHGQVARWKVEYVPEGIGELLKEEAARVVSEGVAKDKALFAGAKSILEGRDVIVETGEFR